MKPSDIQSAAAILWQSWGDAVCINELPAVCRPADRAEGYAIQAELARLSGQAVAGWKIAATSLAGQAHIGVDGPLAGRLLANRTLHATETNAPIAVSLQGNRMRVAEAEFAFRFGRALPKRPEEYRLDEVLSAVATLHPAIEIPDSRYEDFVGVGAPQLIADNACACWFVLGHATTADWRHINLAEHAVTAYCNGSEAATGSGTNVLGDPRWALTWIANELSCYGDGLRVGDIVTTGTCIKPVAITEGDQLRADFGVVGEIAVACV